MSKSYSHVQYGCGLCAPTTWRNFDVSPNLRIQKIPLIGSILTSGERFPEFPENVEYGDIVEGLPVEKNSVSAIYCSHVLEHLALEDVREALENTYGYLTSGGTFRLVVPDLERRARHYLSSEKPDAAHQFMRSTHLGQEARPQGVEAVLRQIIGNSEHRWMWDYSALSLELKQVGFKEIRRAEYGDSEDPLFDDVEDKGRWKDNLGIECRKP
ncbi:hypothetical protein GGQ18_003341 [Salinibacter ruber]|uniref:class I SAM-dependent methyltransferase n=1 Tax=Salinibacter ruber TaxID=146919 RepID=UPI001620AD13|nr:methyltransferase domain-containing protein [Salinibacter ruber]MBB4070723.1 hypothetical protein [Salinibacter ruber]